MITGENLSRNILRTLALELWSSLPDLAGHCVLRSIELYLMSRNVLGGSTLDLGCGDGVVTSLMIKQGRFKGVLYGVDTSVKSLSKAKKKNVYDCLIRADARKLPFRDRSFDSVFSVSVLEHIGRCEIVFDEVHKMLTPSGRFYFTVVDAERFSTNYVFNKILALSRIKRVSSFFVRRHMAKNIHVVTKNTDDWVKTFQEKGFRVTNKKNIWPDEYLFFSNIFSIMAYAFSKIFKYAGKIMIELFFSLPINTLSDGQTACVFIEGEASHNST